jgi:hypothetical protein
MWERAVREFIGLTGTIRQVRGFRMRSFNVVGDTVVVRGTVGRKWREEESSTEGFVELRMQTESHRGITVGPGTVVATLACRVHSATAG